MIGFMADLNDTKNDEPRFELEEGKDMICLGEGLVFPARSDDINNNILVCGPTRAGKSTGILLPTMLHSHSHSIVMPIVKRKIYDQCAPLLKSRGYTVIDLNLSKPKDSPCGWDPLRSVHDEDDYITLAESIVGGESRTMFQESDPYWKNACSSCIAAMMMLSRFLNGSTSGFMEFMALYRSLEVTFPNGHARSNLDSAFEDMEMTEPESSAPKLWRQLQGNASRTGACIVSLVHSALSKYCGEWGKEVFGKRIQLDPSIVGKKKTAIFITTNSVSVPGKQLMNLLISDMIRQLFELAESRGGELAVPVLLCADDFAAGARIMGFGDYISTFCAAGISAIILIQSLSQLSSIYGDYEARTIINNCDTIACLGTNCIETARELSERVSCPVEDVLNMKPGEVIITRRGMMPRFAKRYRTFEDPVYLSSLDNIEKG